MKRVLKPLMLGSLILSFQACSVKVPLSEIKTSKNQYEKPMESLGNKKLDLKSALNEKGTFNVGVNTEDLSVEYKGKELNRFSFVKNSLRDELKARKLPLAFTSDATDKLELKQFEIFSYQDNKVSPYITLASIKIEGDTSRGKRTFSSIIKRSNNFQWDEKKARENGFDEPMSLMIKEVVAKLNKNYFDYELEDEKILILKSRIKRKILLDDYSVHKDIYELGFSNNKKALPVLRKYAGHSNRDIQLSAISMLGLIGGQSQFEYLTQVYNKNEAWDIKAMSLKAIADISSKSAKKFIQKEYEFWEKENSKENLFMKNIFKVLL